jgi:GDSL-like Lipase/Acylhydrolase family
VQCVPARGPYEDCLVTRGLFQYHPVFGFQFVPGVRARVPHETGGYLVRANASGFRSDREFVREKPTGVFRVLLFGDSYTAGDGVSNPQRYSDLVETLLPGTEVYNYGLPGTGTDQHFLVYREIAASVDHDAVVIAVQVENIRRVVARYREFTDRGGERVILAKPYFTIGPAGELELHNVPVPREPVSPDDLGSEAQFVDRGGDLQFIRQALNRLGPGVKSLVQAVVGADPVPGYSRPDHPAWRLMRAILEQWIESSDAPVIIMPIPLYHHIEELARPDGYQARFAELARPPRVTIHDPLPAFHRVPRDARRAYRFERDVHPTPAAHRVFAQSLADALRSVAEPRPLPQT